MRRLIFAVMLVPGLILLTSCQSQDQTDGVESSIEVDDYWGIEEPQNPQQARELLMNTDEFADVAAGDTAVTSLQVKAFRIVLAQPDATAAFTEILEKGQIAGQLYALCGLYLKDRASFDRVIDDYKASKESVSTLMGCIGSTQKVSSLVYGPHPNTIRLEPGQTLKDWYDNHSRGYYNDISGGGYPYRFSGDE